MKLYKIKKSNIDRNGRGLYATKKIKAGTKIIEYELMTKALHPSRISKWLEYHIENGGDICNFEY